VVVGISEYSSTSLQLGFAATDAEDFARALQLGGSRLFGSEHVHIKLLATLAKSEVPKPTKANLKNAFQSFRRSRPSDVFVVYFAGHGVTVHDMYAYPTQEARTLDLSDPGVRNESSITSEELLDWLNAIPATHQVMILDTCAAGAAQKKLVEKREVPGDQIRALDRLTGSTGFYVLMGAAADAASYEASQYGQGLLTYSLLAGMRGAALREEKFVDVSKLFQYAADEVPQLARNVGGIQKPLILVPKDSTSFDVGQLETEDKQAIPLAFVKPVILRPVVLNRIEGTDNLQLTAALRVRLRNVSYISVRGEREQSQPKTVFVDEDEFPGGIHPTGFYRIEGEQVMVTLILSRDGERVGQLEVSGSARDVTGLAEKIVANLTQALLELPDNTTP
jgi:hypothetical protein